MGFMKSQFLCFAIINITLKHNDRVNAFIVF